MVNRFKLWTPRRIEMTNTTVQYSSGMLGVSGGSFNLEGALVTDSQKHEHDFDVYTKDKNKLTFRADSIAQKKSWMNDFKIAMDAAKRSSLRDVDWFFALKNREEVSLRFFMGGRERFKEIVRLVTMFPKTQRKKPEQKRNSRRYGRRVSAEDLSALILPPPPAQSVSGDDSSTLDSVTTAKSCPDGDGKLGAVAAASSAQILHKSSSPVVNESVAEGGDKSTAAPAATGDKSVAEGGDKSDVAVDASAAESTDKSELTSVSSTATYPPLPPSSFDLSDVSSTSVTAATAAAAAVALDATDDVSASPQSPTKLSFSKSDDEMTDFPEFEFSPLPVAPPTPATPRGEFCLQFRVLTRGKASFVKKMLEELYLVDYIHSIWDMTGCGVSPFDEEYVIDREAHKSDNKLVYVDHWARFFRAHEVIFVEDVNASDGESYDTWQQANPCPPYKLDIIRLPYESSGIDEECCANLKQRIAASKKAQRKLLLVMDFDCTITSTHFYKTLFWPSSRYARRLKQWMIDENLEEA